MAGRRVYGGSTVAALLQSERIPQETIQTLLAPGSSYNEFHGTGSMVNFEDVCESTPQGPLHRMPDLEETVDDDLGDYFHQPEKKRRLTADQVQFLEKSFETENKLEPERKLQLAKDLGLQPRQVAIWYQNRRARWKNKQLEKDYEALRSSYHALKSDYEELVKEKERLQAEVMLLNNQLLKERKDNLEDLQLYRSPSALQIPLCESESEAKRHNTQLVVMKQEDLSSANSTILDYDSPQIAGAALQSETTGSSNVFEPDQSDLSYTEDDGEIKGYHFLKLEDHAGNYELPVEDHAFWFWHCSETSM